LPTAARRSHSPDTGERAFAYAKACGVIGKSFVGKRAPALKNLNTLAALDRLVFPEEHRVLPERELLNDIESRILQRTTRHILSVINSFSDPPEFLVRQLRSCEYADLKTCLHHISAGRPIPSRLSDIGRFRTVRFEAYPGIKAMIGGTEFDWIPEQDLKAMSSAGYDFTRLETELDLRYYTLLVRSVRSLPVSDRLITERLLAEEISLRNCVWAMRLRIYFHKTQNEAAENLMDMKMPREENSLAAEAREMLSFPLDHRSSWKGWRWEKLLNPEIAGEEWAVNPRYFQNAASRYIYHLARRSFNQMPFSLSSIFCFIKLKQFEEDLLTSITEGLGLGMTGSDVFRLIEAPV
jgi:vacuolar-type H+-ATPase subunit C/Vma6